MENKTSENLDIKKMSEETGIPIPVIKLALNIPFTGKSEAKTSREAWDLWAVSEAGTEIEIIHFLKWIVLMDDFTQVLEAYKKGNKFLKKLVFKKGVELISTLEEVSELGELMTYDVDDIVIDEDILYNFYNKWSKLFFDKAKNIETIKDIEEIIEFLPPENHIPSQYLSLFSNFISKYITLISNADQAIFACQTEIKHSNFQITTFVLIKDTMNDPEQALQAEDLIPNNIEVNIVVDFYEKWSKLTIEKSNTATNLHEAKEAYMTAPRQSQNDYYSVPKISEANDISFLKYLEFITDKNEAVIAYNMVADFDLNLEINVIKKLATFF